ncbi:hypothetical protein G6011_07945 [Alternaria panax]|uniref:Rhodopsin domain-containing protein n=1 Tax=Alternaria panax TaxID=48097 RepID=A0AAD4F9Q0_9PLEO|nr:hypothetical protein G6011_07945 [Alternaria panax]
MGLFVISAYTVMIVLANRWLKIQSNLEPEGFEWSALTVEELSRRRFGSKLVVVVEQMHIAVIWACKACLLIMYHRITRTALQKENIAIKILAVYTALGFVVIEVLYFSAWCRPFSEYYAVPTSSFQCTALVHHRITKAIFNISSDLIMLCIALQMLIRSQLPMKRKIILCGIFSLGIFVVAASIMNSYYSFSNPYKSTWIYWYVRESSTAILVANLPFTWTILRELFELGNFDEGNPPPWSYHSPRTAGGRKTAQLLHQQSATTGARTGTKRSPNNTIGSKSMTLTPSNMTKDQTKSPALSDVSGFADKDLRDEAIQPHDFAPVLLRTTNDDSTVAMDLESGHIEETNIRPVSPDHAQERDKLMAAPPRITEDGTGGFYVNDHPIAPPSRVHLVLSINGGGARDSSTTASSYRRPSATSSLISGYTGSRRGSASTQGAAVGGHTAGGGRSARDRRARTKLNE